MFGLNKLFGREAEKPKPPTMAEMGYEYKASMPKPGHAPILRDDSVRAGVAAPTGIALDRRSPQEQHADKILAGNNWSIEPTQGSKIPRAAAKAESIELFANRVFEHQAASAQNPAASRFAARIQERGAEPARSIDPTIKERFAQSAERSAAARSALAAQQVSEQSQAHKPRIK